MYILLIYPYYFVSPLPYPISRNIIY